MVKYFAYESIAVGANRGYKTTALEHPTRPSRRRNGLHRVATKEKKDGQKKQHPVKIVRDVIRDTVGYAPFERRIQELIKPGNQKRALKFAKKRLGTHKRAKNKRTQME